MVLAVLSAQYNSTVNVENSFFQLCDFPKTQITSMFFFFLVFSFLGEDLQGNAQGELRGFLQT